MQETQVVEYGSDLRSVRRLPRQFQRPFVAAAGFGKTILLLMKIAVPIPSLVRAGCGLDCLLIGPARASKVMCFPSTLLMI